MARKPSLPSTGDGELMLSAGKRSRQIVLDVFELVGGTEAMADWARKNPTDFYTKLFTKTITREADVNHTVGIEALIDDLDALEGGFSDEMVLEGDFEELTDEDMAEFYEED